MSASLKTQTDFGQIWQQESPEKNWEVVQSSRRDCLSDSDVIEHLQYNIQQLEELNHRFNFVLKELSTILVKKSPDKTGL